MVRDLRLVKDDDDRVAVVGDVHGQFMEGSEPRLTMSMPNASSSALAEAASLAIGRWRGNTSDKTTLARMSAKITARHGNERRSWIMD